MRLSLLSACALLLSACGNQLVGTWSATGVPFTFGATSITLDPTLTMDDKNNATIKLVAHLTSSSSITATAEGTFTSTATELTLTLPKAISAKDSNGTTQVATTQDGKQCVTIAGAALCFPTPQKNAYAVVGDKLTMTVNYQVDTGAVSPLGLQLTKSK